MRQRRHRHISVEWKIYRNAAQSVPGTMRIEGSNRRLSLHWTSLAEGNANFPIVIVFRYADDLMAGFEHREEPSDSEELTSTLPRPQSTHAEGG
jgi:hypothetical protein